MGRSALSVSVTGAVLLQQATLPLEEYFPVGGSHDEQPSSPSATHSSETSESEPSKPYGLKISNQIPSCQTDARFYLRPHSLSLSLDPREVRADAQS